MQRESAEAAVFEALRADPSTGSGTRRLAFALGRIPTDARSILDAGCGDGRIANLPSRGHLVAACHRSSAGALQWWAVPGFLADQFPSGSR